MKCGLCSSIFHEQCITKHGGCPCASKPTTSSSHKDKAATQETTVQKPSTYNVDTDCNDIKLKGEILDSQIQKKNYGLDVKSSTGFLSELLSKAKPEKLWNSINSRTNPVILMSSLPSNSL